MRDELDIRPKAFPVLPSVGADLPGEVRIRVASRRGSPVTLRFGVLDPETRRIYWRLSEDGSADPTRYVVERKFRGLDIDVPDDAALAWLTSDGLGVADAAVEEYVSRGTVDREELKLLALAAQALFIASADKDPYEISDHAEECDGDVWEDYDAGALIDEEELEERDCSACFFEHELWAGIMEDTGGVAYGRMASQAIALDRYLADYPLAAQNLTSREWDLVQAVRYERDRYEAQRQKNARDQAQQANNAGAPRRAA